VPSRGTILLILMFWPDLVQVAGVQPSRFSRVIMPGLAFVLRDLVQRRLGLAWTILAIGLGGALSALVSPAALVMASAEIGAASVDHLDMVHKRLGVRPRSGSKGPTTFPAGCFSPSIRNGGRVTRWYRPYRTMSYLGPGW
jgi:hypothetical protein